MRLLLITFLVVWATICSGQVITGFSGDIGNGSQLSIQGSGFGPKEQSSPLIWDNVESGEFSSAWSSTNHLSLSNSSRHPSSHYSGTINFQGSGGDGSYGYGTAPGSPLSERWFVQYWFKLDTNFDWGTSTYGNGDENLANVKIFRMWNPGSIDENFVIALHGFVGSAPYSSEYITDPGGGRTLHGYMDDWEKGVWHCLQFEYKESSVNTQDGTIRVWFDGDLALEDNTIKTREDYSVLKRPFIVGFYDSWNDDNSDRDDVYFDDFYVDNTWARVEIGNAPVYSQCTHREIQIPNSWNDDSISINAQFGSFPESADLYLFVVDGNGNASPGYLARGDGEPDPGPPGEPGQPTRISGP